MRRMRRGLKRAGDALVGFLGVRTIKGLRLFDPDRLTDFAGWVTRTIGPLLPENRIGRANLTAAFPEKTPAEIDAILRGVWDNLGRMGAEFAHLDRLWDFDPETPGAAQPLRHHTREPRARHAACNRRQTGADLCSPSRQLGAAGDIGRGRTASTALCFIGGPISAPSTAG